MNRNRRFFPSLCILLFLSFGFLAVLDPKVDGADVRLSLYGDGMIGWGLTPDTMASPGPTINVDMGDQVNVTLVSVDGVMHDFGVDYSGNGFPDPDEPLSDYFGGGYPSSTVYTFTVSVFPGTYSYFCYFHRGVMSGYFAVGGNQPPSAVFSFQPSSPKAGQQVLFDASSSSDPGGKVTSYDWNFGDGTMESGVVLNHSFPSEGNFTVVLSVTDNLGASSSSQQTVRVYPAAPTNNPPVADFVFVPDNPRAGQAVSFDASGSHDDDSGDRISLYLWNFGDGETEETFSPTTAHRYANGGVFNIALTVKDSLSPQMTATAQKTVIVKDPDNSLPPYLPFLLGFAGISLGAAFALAYLRARRRRNGIATQSVL